MATDVDRCTAFGFAAGALPLAMPVASALSRRSTVSRALLALTQMRALRTKRRKLLAAVLANVAIVRLLFRHRLFNLRHHLTRTRPNRSPRNEATLAKSHKVVPLKTRQLVLNSIDDRVKDDATHNTSTPHLKSIQISSESVNEISRDEARVRLAFVEWLCLHRLHATLQLHRLPCVLSQSRPFEKAKCVANLLFRVARELGQRR